MTLTVEDLFRKLSHGPLSNLSLANDGDGTIAAPSQGKMIDYANAGLLKIYGKFVISEKEVIIRMIEGVTNYYLLKRFSQSDHGNHPSDPVYIMDSLNPFQEDVLQILEVHGPDGKEMKLNDSADPRSFFTPKPYQLQVPHPIDTAPLGVLYKAKHKTLEYGVLGSTIWLPDNLEEALIEFIAARTFSHMNGQENTIKGQEHLAAFKELIGETIENDLANSSMSSTSTNFERNGFI